MTLGAAANQLDRILPAGLDGKPQPDPVADPARRSRQADGPAEGRRKSCPELPPEPAGTAGPAGVRTEGK